MSTFRTHRIYNDRRWKIIRKAALERDQYLCQLRLPGCTHLGTHGDHVISLEEGGAPFLLSNVQASCGHCNVAKENMRRQGIPIEQAQARPSRQW